MGRAFKFGFLLFVASSIKFSFSFAKEPINALASTRDIASDHPVSVEQVVASGDLGFTNVGNLAYSVTIQVNGVPFQVILDTGIGDSFLDPLSVASPPDFFYTGFNSSADFGPTVDFNGTIVLADVTIGPYTIKNQAMLLAPNSTSGSPIFNGLMGIAGVARTHSPSRSSIFKTLANTSFAENGIPVLQNLFEHQPNVSDFISILLSRSPLADQFTDGGVLAISEVVEDLAGVLSLPPLESPVSDVWDVIVDGLYVNGQFVSGVSNLTAEFKAENKLSLPEGSMLAQLDTGGAIVLAPVQIVNAIYGNIPGAVPTQNITGEADGFVLPCDTKINITWSINGFLYPMDPADVIDATTDDDGNLFCFGTILAHTLLNKDMDIGSNFLRNVYAVYDFGDPDAIFVKPSVRLLSITDPETAFVEFDSFMLQLILALEASDQSNATSTAALPVFTGSVPPVTLTSVNIDDPIQTAAITPIPLNANSRIAGALSDDGSEAVDLSTVNRNSTIILALVVVVLVMLLVVIALAVKANRANKGYRAVPSTTHFGTTKLFEADPEPYSTPYDSRPSDTRAYRSGALRADV
ncbi:aspartic peptidase domain-containing protein [Trametes punicea]|nr:aspartic peptidase domain-containing protein [Trametes punicea]